jgi:hypothetical protein
MSEHRDGAVLETHVSRKRDEEAERERMRHFFTESLNWESKPGQKSGAEKWQAATERFITARRF